MRKFIKFQQGFTLIELLIVIALLGALAVGLLAALDPFEQLKKGTDTGVRNTVSEIHGAVIRYYGIKSQMPWCANALCTNLETGWTEDQAVAASAISAPGGVIDNMVVAGELKEDFVTLAGTTTLGKIFLTGNKDTATIAVCYRPTSKSFLADPNSKFDSAGQPATCDTADLATCFWCVK